MTLLTLQHKHDYHIENMSCTAIMLNGHIDQSYLPTSAKIQATALTTSQNIAKYVVERNMPIKCQIYASYANY